MGYKILFLLVILDVLCCFDTEAHKGPRNSVFLMKQNATLKCRDDDASENTKPVWKFYGVNSKLPKTIYEDGRILIGDERFTVDETVDKHYDLIIDNTDKKDAGPYTCQTSAGSYLALLIILASNPICEKQPYENGMTDASYYVELTCSVQFWGGWPPTFQWHIVNGSELDASNTRSTDDIVMSSVIVSVNSTHKDEMIVQCTTYFQERTWDVVIAKNVPQYRYIWTSDIRFHSDPLSDTTTDEKRHESSTYSSFAGEINTDRKESSPPDLFQIVSTTLLSIICMLMLVAFMAFIVIKCFRGENTYSHRYYKKNETAIHATTKPVDTTLEQNVDALGKLDIYVQRGSSEYYSEIDESQIEKTDVENQDMAVPELGYIQIQRRDVAIEEVDTTNYEQCNTSGPIQVHTYEERTAAIIGQEGESDGPEAIASSYDQLETANRSGPITPSVYTKCSDI